MDNENGEFRLQWKSHKQTLITLLDSLLEKECLVDVTLAADGKFVRAHRLVLCACSQYFEDLLGSTSDKQAIVFLKDIPFTVVKALVEYMYRGEVNVTHNELNLFLSSGEALKIKGLIGNRDESSPLSESKTQSPPRTGNKVDGNNRIPPLVPARRFEFVPAVPLDSPVPNTDSLSNCTHSIKQESPQLPQSNDLVAEDNFMAVDDTERVEELSGMLTAEDPFGEHVDAERVSQEEHSINGTNLPASEGIVLDEANMTDKLRKLSDSLSNGLDSTLTKGRSDCTCPKCGRWYKRRESLSRHRRFECGQEPKFKCLLCPMLFKRKDKLRDHEMRRHPQDPLLLANQADQVLNSRPAPVAAKEYATRRRSKN